ncbi:tRNA-specific adenosine deaminase 2 [Pancytospora epiphaga]|nr:tRNA-specific adenosine deaminase 2 [Pancytospora epiphaga]
MTSSSLYNHSYYMDLAIKQAQKALEIDEVPVGCVLVYDGHISIMTHNMTNRESDPLCHAEYMAVLEFFGIKGWTGIADFKLPMSFEASKLVLYITMEPCVMCHGILRRLNATVYFGCYNDIFGTRKLTGETAGIYIPDSRCIEMIREFYTKENTLAPEEKRINKTGRHINKV